MHHILQQFAEGQNIWITLGLFFMRKGLRRGALSHDEEAYRFVVDDIETAYQHTRLGNRCPSLETEVEIVRDQIVEKISYYKELFRKLESVRISMEWHKDHGRDTACVR